MPGSSNFPTALDTFTDPTPVTLEAQHAEMHDESNDAIVNLEAKVGVNGSSDQTSLDWLVKHSVRVPAVGLLANKPVNPSFVGQSYYATDQNGGTFYLSPDGANWDQIGPGILPSPTSGSRMVLFGHSLAASGGASPATRGWEDLLAGMARGRLWNQAVGGAVLSYAGFAPGTTGYGGITQILQGYVPNPSVPITWRGPWVSGTTYRYMEGVSSGGNWWVYQAIASGSQTTAPAPGGAWLQVTSPTSQGAGNYAPVNTLPILMFGNNDLGAVFNKDPSPFLCALEVALSRLMSCNIYEDNNSMVALASMGTAVAFSGQAPVGSGTQITHVANTAGATITFNTPADWPGGYVDFVFLLGWNDTVASAGVSGTLNFTVDGGTANGYTLGQAIAGGAVTFSTAQQPRLGMALTTALVTTGGNVSQLPVTGAPAAINLNDTIVVGTGASQETFTASAAVAQTGAAVNIPVTPKTPQFAHAVGDPVTDGTPGSFKNGWIFNNAQVVRISVPSGAHSVVATVPATPNIGNLYFDCIQLENSSFPQQLIVTGLWHFLSNLYWPTNPLDQDVDSWNTQIQNMIGPGKEFSTGVFASVTDLFRPASQLTTALTAGQVIPANGTIAVTPLPYPVQVNDVIRIGSGLFAETVTATAAAAQGATAIQIAAMTFTYAHPTTDYVIDMTVVTPNYSVDLIHPGIAGHQKLAKIIWNLFQQLPTDPQKVAAYSAEIGSPIVQQIVNPAANTVVGTGTASQWGKLNDYQAAIAADPGDIIEVSLDCPWGASASGSAGYLDIATYDTAAAAPINFMSGVQSLGAPLSSLGFGVVGAQKPVGLPSLISLGGATTIMEKASGTFRYPVQPADIKGGVVTFVLYGETSAVATRVLADSTTYQGRFVLRNTGPGSYGASSA